VKGPRHHHKKKSHEADRSAVAPAAPTWTLAAPHPMRSIGELHRAIGNHAVGRLLQRKLVVNAPGDVHEQEADRVADAVMRATPASPPPALNHTAPMPRGVQRACSCGGTCEDCRQAEALQRKEGSIGIAGAGTAAPPIVNDVLRSPGQPLDATTRAYMEPRFGRSFVTCTSMPTRAPPSRHGPSMRAPIRSDVPLPSAPVPTIRIARMAGNCWRTS